MIGIHSKYSLVDGQVVRQALFTLENVLGQRDDSLRSPEVGALVKGV